MTKTTATIAILLGLTLVASAQSNSGLFGRGPETEENDHNTPNGGLINLPGSHGSTDDADAPLGGGIALLTGLGTAYLVAKKRKNTQRGAMMALLALLAFGPTAWAQNGIYCTASDKNRVVCTDGTIYDNVAAATADGKTAAAKIIYIDESNKAGLALALRDEGQYTQADGITACNNKNTSMPVVGGTWKLASKSEWDKMISAAGSGEALFEGFSSVGGTDMLTYYWSSETDESGVNGLIIQEIQGWSGFVSNAQTVPVRACLTFNLLTLLEIGSQSEWSTFCSAVNIGFTFSDNYVKLTSDIIVSEMAGSSESNSFRGLFDGDGHTLTVSYSTEYAVTAPFRYVNNATIRNLKTTGAITTSAMCAAGIVGKVAGSLNLISCSSSVAISSSRGDIDNHGGLVASNNGNVTINGCVFDGSFAATVAHTNSYGTTFCGGIVGMCNENTSATITNSLVAPSSVSEGMINETFVGLYEGATVTIENCYFVATANLPSNQGTQVYYTAPANEISKSITISGTTVYYACTVSGVEATYNLDSGLASVTPTVTDPFAATLTFGTDYTATLNGNAVQNLPVKISTAGNYTLVLTGAGSYTGTKTFNITATGDPVNSALIISSEAEWDTFAESVNNGNNYSDQFVKLTADISVSTMVGTSETNSFQGTFLGDGTHTLTFTKGTAESAFGEENCAPFRFVKNATIRDLKVTGDIYTSRKFAAGLVARNSGETNITNCQVGTVIHSSVNGDGTHGGIVAMPASGTTTNIEGCVFNGRLLTKNGTNSCGGFVGWHGGATVSISNSLYAPSSIPTGWTTITDGATFVRGGSPTIDNCYYTATMGAAQGKASRTVTAGTDVTIQAVALTGTTTEYTVSDITAYSGGGLQRGGTLYYGSGDQLSLTLTNTATAPDSYRYDGYNASAGTLSGSDADGWILLMPDEDVTISLGPLAPIDWATQSTGTAADPYLIYNKDQLDLLAHRVNGTHGESANDYSGKHFRLGADITYTHGDSDTDSNYEAIGYYYGYDNHRNFRGTFDGDGHTVSGIRIYKGGTAYADRFQGLFGRIGNGAEVKNVILADARITGYNSTGAIVGYNDTGGIVTDCHALADVTVHAVQSNVCYHGGIAGFNDEGTVTRCTSAAALTTAGSNSRYFGGIAGYSSYGTVTDCIYLGTTLEGASYVGAIVGSNYGTGTVETSYFTNTAIQGKDDSGNTLGNAASAVSYNNGGTIANSGLAHTVTLGESVTLGDTPTGEGRVKAYGDYALSYSDGTETTLYSTAGSTIALAYSGTPAGYTVTYTVNGEAISGSIFTMPDEDVTVSVNLIPYFTRTVDGYGEGDGGWVFIASPVAGSIGATAVSNLEADNATDFDLYRFNPSADLEWENWKQEGNHHHFNLENGRGYLYATKETKTLVFSGSFNMNDTKTIENLSQGFNLVGNPFIVDAYVSKPYYTLNEDGSVILSTTSQAAIAPCHGVIVEVDGNESVTFSKTAPAATANQGLLNITVAEQKADTRGASTGSATAIDNAIVRFGEGEQLGKFHFGNPSANISIPQGGKEYAVANVNVGTDVARNVSTNEMPVNFKATKDGEYTISFNPENVEFDYLHLIDNLTGSDVDLLALRQAQGPASYTFTAKTTDYASRFRLVFSASGDACEPSVNFAFISNGNVIVNGEGTLQVVDVTGRVVRCSDGVHTVSTNGMTSGMYVLRLIEGNNVRIQKIVIE